MGIRIYVENPPPFRRTLSARGQSVNVPIERGLETVPLFLHDGAHVAGFHHSDLDPYETKPLHERPVSERYPTFAYAALCREKLNDFTGVFVPHRAIVYQPPMTLLPEFLWLIEHNIRDFILVGKPFSSPPEGRRYHNSVEIMLAFLRDKLGDAVNLGVIGIHTRKGEAQRMANKFEAAGGRLRVMGQFLDSAEAMIRFMDELALEFDRRRLDLSLLEWNAGLAIFALKDRRFFAQLLRKQVLACEGRFVDLESVEQRIDTSIAMNLEFAERLKHKAAQAGLDLGFSVQPIIERRGSTAIHASVFGALELVKRLRGL